MQFASRRAALSCLLHSSRAHAAPRLHRRCPQFEQVTLPGVEGYFGVKATHVPTIAQLKPGVVELHDGTDVSKYFISGGYAFVHANSTADICVLEAAPLDQFDGAAVKSALTAASSAGAPRLHAAPAFPGCGVTRRLRLQRTPQTMLVPGDHVEGRVLTVGGEAQLFVASGGDHTHPSGSAGPCTSHKGRASCPLPRRRRRRLRERSQPRGSGAVHGPGLSSGEQGLRGSGGWPTHPGRAGRGGRGPPGPRGFWGRMSGVQLVTRGVTEGSRAAGSGWLRGCAAFLQSQGAAGPSA